MRENYRQYGVDGYYRNFGQQYRNAKEIESTQCIGFLLTWWKDNEDLGKTHDLTVLDLACGSGEATRAFLDWWDGLPRQAPDKFTIRATDPYTASAYNKQTGLECLDFSFTDIADGAHLGVYTITICSFALHLVEPSRLFITLYQISLWSRWLLVTSPHTKPSITLQSGWKLCLGVHKHKIRGALYRSVNFQ